MLDHLFRDFEIGDHAIAHRADRLDIAGGAAQHHLGVIADRANLLLAALAHHRNDGWFIEHDAATLDINERIRRSKVDGHITR